jgi:hypothetical protein
MTRVEKYYVYDYRRVESVALMPLAKPWNFAFLDG